MRKPVFWRSHNGLMQRYISNISRHQLANERRVIENNESEVRVC